MDKFLKKKFDSDRTRNELQYRAERTVKKVKVRRYFRDNYLKYKFYS